MFLLKQECFSDTFVSSVSCADFGWWASSSRERVSVAEPACLWVDQSTGLSLVDGHEYGPIHTWIHGEGSGRTAALVLGQWQVEGKENNSMINFKLPIMEWIIQSLFHCKRSHYLVEPYLPWLPPGGQNMVALFCPKTVHLSSSGTRCVESERPFNHQEETEGHA